MREFLLLPLVIVGLLVLAPLVLIGLVIVSAIFMVGEKQGWARMGGFYQDDHDY
ncbi:MAG: hypothetical protein K0S56_1488 [Microvirga sp.]|jgi:hypothetical protein|nr:hypothetical protein [Microvirga sp.]